VIPSGVLFCCEQLFDRGDTTTATGRCTATLGDLTDRARTVTNSGPNGSFVHAVAVTDDHGFDSSLPLLKINVIFIEPRES